MGLRHRRTLRQAVHFPVMSPIPTSRKVSNKTAKTVPTQDRAHDVLRSEPHPLDAIFAPRSVAVIGATDRPGSVGRAVIWSLVSNPFGGTVYPVSDKRSSVLGIKAYKSVADLPETVDLAVVITPAVTVPGIIGDCAVAGVRGAIVISAGFKEHGEKAECDVRFDYRAPGQRRLHQPERGLVHGDSRLGAEGNGGIQFVRVSGVDARRRLG
jgi:acyl-CoA synthetase (NDP forming)